MIKLGDKVAHDQPGHQPDVGTVTGKREWLNGEVQYFVEFTEFPGRSDWFQKEDLKTV